MEAKNSKFDELIKDIESLLERKKEIKNYKLGSKTKRVDNLISETKMEISNNEMNCAKKNNNDEEEKILKPSSI